MGRLDGRVAIIIGAGHGVGRAIARRFAREGASVVVAELNPETGAAVAAKITDELGGQAVFQPTDVMNHDDVEATVARAVSEFGTVHILVNNAYVAGSFGRFEQARWRPRARVPRRPAAHLVGHAGRVPAHEGATVGAASSTWCRSTESTRTSTRRIRTRPRRASAPSLAPPPWSGGGTTSCATALRRQRRLPRTWLATAAPENAQAMSKSNPLGRMGDPEHDIGGVALFLASDDSDYVTGNTIFASGGTQVNGVQWDPPMPD